MPGTKLPDYVPLSDGAGEVVAVADGIIRVKVGDRVNPLFALGWLYGSRPTADMLGGPADGVAREFFACDAESLVILPDIRFFLTGPGRLCKSPPDPIATDSV